MVNMVNKCIFHTNVRSITQKRMTQVFKLVYRMTLGNGKSWKRYGFRVLRSQNRVRVRVKATAIRRGFELYECLLVIVVVVVVVTSAVPVHIDSACL